MSIKEFFTVLVIGVFKNAISIGWMMMVASFPSIAEVLSPFNNGLVSQVVATGVGVVVVALLGALYHRAMQNKKVAEVAEAAFDEGGQAMKHAIDVSTGAAASLGDPALWNPPPKAEIKSPANGGFIVTSLGVLITLVALATMLALCGCACDRAAYVRQSCGTGGTNICTVIIMPDGGATVLPMGDSAIKAAADAAMASSGISAAGAAATGAAKAIGTVEAIKASKP